MTSAFNIQTMTRSDIGFAIDLAANEGSNPGVEDAGAFYAADPDGFLMGRIEDRPIGCISAVKYPGGFGFVGIYIVVPPFRGQGYGIQLWHAAMERLAGCMYTGAFPDLPIDHIFGVTTFELG